jgi:hypothetical protein
MGLSRRTFTKAAALQVAGEVRGLGCSADGKRFLIAAPPASGAPSPASHPYHVVMNWTELLKR